MKLISMAVTATTLVAVTAGVATPAVASVGDHLAKHTEGVARVNYSGLQNAPGSPKPKALRLETFGLDTKAQVRARDIGMLGRAIGDIGRLSLKARHSGAPRMVLKLSNGHWLFLDAGANCSGGVDFGSGWFKYDFANDPTCGVHTDTGATYANFAAAVAGEGAGNTIEKARVTQNDVDDTGWVDDIRFRGTMFAGPNVNTHVHR